MPVKLQKYIELSAWSDAIHFYMKTIDLVRRHQDIASFATIERESNVHIQRIVSNLRSIFCDQVSSSRGSRNLIRKLLDFLIWLTSR